VKKEESKYELTAQGFNVVKIFQKNNQPKEVWDGKWRIVMFDIPEKTRENRNWLRWQLISLDYKPIQKSVFIGKQPIKEDFYEEILMRKLNQCVRLMTVGEIDNEEFL
jgi:DNA-binding transcriptional regulator PaaX